MSTSNSHRKRLLALPARPPGAEPEPFDRLPGDVARTLERLAEAGGLEEVFPDSGLARTPRTIAPGSSPQDRA